MSKFNEATINHNEVISLNNTATTKYNPRSILDLTKLGPLVQAMAAAKGWNKNHGIMYIIEMQPSEQADALKQLTHQWDDLKSDSSNDEARMIFEDEFVIEGKIVVPEYRAVTANRRWNAIPLAFLESECEDFAEFGQIPVEILPADTSPLELLIIQSDENESKNKGQVKFSLEDCFNIGKQLVASGCSQQKCRDALGGAGRGQRWYHAAIVDNRFPSIEFGKSLFDGSLKIEHFKHTDMTRLSNQSDADWVEENNANPKKNPVELLDIDSMREAIQTIHIGKKEVKPMPKDAIERLAKNQPNHMIKEVARIIRKDDAKALNYLNQFDSLYNELYQFTASNPSAEQIEDCLDSLKMWTTVSQVETVEVSE